LIVVAYQCGYATPAMGWYIVVLLVVLVLDAFRALDHHGRLFLLLVLSC
jgi:hypothetical protein